MTKQQIQKEWERLRLELVENKPRIKGPYPPEVVDIRELLLVARFALCKTEAGERVSFYESLYQRIVKFYVSHRGT